MVTLVLVGWVLLAAAFVAAAGEIVVRLQGGPVGYVSAYDLLYTLWPGRLVVAQALVERWLAPEAWSWGLRPLLALPAWLLVGLPGGVLAWRFRARDEATEEDEEAAHSVFMYDELARAARDDETYVRDEDDMAPDHAYQSLFDDEDEKRRDG